MDIFNGNSRASKILNMSFSKTSQQDWELKKRSLQKRDENPSQQRECDESEYSSNGDSWTNSSIIPPSVSNDEDDDPSQTVFNFSHLSFSNLLSRNRIFTDLEGAVDSIKHIDSNDIDSTFGKSVASNPSFVSSADSSSDLVPVSGLISEAYDALHDPLDYPLAVDIEEHMFNLNDSTNHDKQLTVDDPFISSHSSNIVSPSTSCIGSVENPICKPAIGCFHEQFGASMQESTEVLDVDAVPVTKLVDYSSSEDDELSYCNPSDNQYAIGENYDTSATAGYVSLSPSDDKSVMSGTATFTVDESSQVDHSVSFSSKSITIYCKDSDVKVKNRKLPCYYCGQLLFQLQRHMIRKHCEEIEVARAMALSDHSKQVQQYQHIIGQGIYKHNVKVLQDGEGILIVARAPAKKTRTVEDFLPCQFCLQFFIKRELYRHCVLCKFRPPDDPSDSFVVNGRALLSGSLILDSSHIDKSLLECVVNRMRIDKLTKVIKGDKLILKLGLMLLHKLGSRRALDISARMRELARILERVRETEAIEGLDVLITPSNFDKILRAIETEGKPDIGADRRKMFNNPAFVIKAGNTILKCAQLKRGAALREGDSIGMKEADDFISLYTSEYTDKMASIAHSSYRMKGNQLMEFPDEEDLRKLKEYQEQCMKQLAIEIKTNPTQAAWRSLAEVTLSRLLVFNARRGSEAAELTLHHLSQVTSSVDSAVAATLSQTEKQLLNRLSVINVIGKRNHPVPILLTPDMQQALSALNNSRHLCAIKDDNQYIFALPHSKSGHLSFYHTMHRVANKACLKKPKLLTTTRMRKHLSTMAQLIDMTPAELAWLSNHLGHDVSTHKNNYRLHSVGIEITKVGRILLAIDGDGDITSEGVGRSDVSATPVSAEQNNENRLAENNSTVSPPQPLKSSRRRQERSTTKQTFSASKRKISDCSAECSRKKKFRRIIVDPDSEEGNSSENMTHVDVMHPVIATSAPLVTEKCDANVSESPSGSRRAWTEEELQFLKKHFSKLVKPPSFQEIRKAQRIFAPLANRTLPQIKSRVWALSKNLTVE